MQTGVITADNFSQILRPISQRRQSGELEITSGDDVTRISFDKGKIIEVKKSGASNCELLFERLTMAGLMQYEEADLPTSYQEALEVFLGATSLDSSRAEKVFVLALHELMYDHLYGFRPYVGAIYNFEMRGVALDTTLLPSLAVNQYLLELPEVEEMRKEAERYEDENPYEIVMLNPASDEEVRGEFSIRIAEEIADGKALLFDDLKLRSLLSEYHFWKGFHELVLTKNIVAGDEDSLESQVFSGETPGSASTSDDAGSPEVESSVEGEDMLSFLENAIDESFEVDPITAKDISAHEGEHENSGALEHARIEPEDDRVKENLSRQSSEEAPRQHAEGISRSLLHSARIPHLVNFLVYVAVITSFFIYWKSFFIYLGRA